MNRSWVLFLLCACATAQQPKRMVVPEGMRREAQPLPRPENKLPAPALQGALQPASATRARDGRYVLRLAEHNRLWELELPESAGGYEMRIPLDGPLESPILMSTPYCFGISMSVRQTSSPPTKIVVTTASAAGRAARRSV